MYRQALKCSSSPENEQLSVASCFSIYMCVCLPSFLALELVERGARQDEPQLAVFAEWSGKFRILHPTRRCEGVNGSSTSSSGLIVCLAKIHQCSFRAQHIVYECLLCAFNMIHKKYSQRRVLVGIEYNVISHSWHVTCQCYMWIRNCYGVKFTNKIEAMYENIIP